MFALIRIYLVQLEHLAAADLLQFEADLTSDERTRFRRFRRSSRAHQFLVGRRLLRTVLGSYLRLEPRSVPLKERPGDSPLLLDSFDQRESNKQTSFSLSHSGTWVACAICEDAKLGLDIEVFDSSRDVKALARHAFSADVATQIEALPIPDCTDLFYQCWTALEAGIKLNDKVTQSLYFRHADLAITICSDRPFHAPVELIDARTLLK